SLPCAAASARQPWREHLQDRRPIETQVVRRAAWLRAQSRCVQGPRGSKFPYLALTLMLLGTIIARCRSTPPSYGSPTSPCCHPQVLQREAEPIRLVINIETVQPPPARPQRPGMGIVAWAIVLLLLASLAHAQPRYALWQATDGWRSQTWTEGCTT